MSTLAVTTKLVEVVMKPVVRRDVVILPEVTTPVVIEADVTRPVLIAPVVRARVVSGLEVIGAGAATKQSQFQ